MDRGLPSAASARPNRPLRLVTLGAIRLTGPAGETVFDQPGPLAVLAYLLAQGGSASRAQLGDLFWAHSENPLHNVRQALSRLRRVLGRNAFADDDNRATLQAPVESDRGGFLRAIETRDLARAVDLYGGDFFSGFSSPGSIRFELWAEAERQHLKTRFVHAAEALARQALTAGEYHRALELARRIGREVPDYEPADRLALEAMLARDPFAARIEAEEIAARFRADARQPEPATARLLRLAREERGAGSATPGPTDLVPDLIGRERQLNSLLTAWDAASQGKGCHIHVTAPSGLGKTRLLAAFALRLRSAGTRVVSLAAQAPDQTLERGFLSSLVESLSQCAGAKAVADAIAGVLVRLNPALAAAYPPVAVQLRHPDSAADRVIAIRDLLREIAEDGPLALLIDDAQWLDPESFQVVSSVLSRLGGSRVLTVTASRPSGATAFYPTATSDLRLEPLTESQIELLLASMAAFPNPDDGMKLATALHASTAGSPLLVLESLKLAIEQGELARAGERWCVRDLPALLGRLSRAGALEKRIASLGPVERDTLLLVAVVAAPLTPDMVNAALGGSEYLSAMHELEHRGFLALGPAGWTVSHDGLSEASIAGADRSSLRRAHLGAARALASRPDLREARIRAIALHYAEAGESGEFGPIFAEWVRERRRKGDRRGARQIAQDVLPSGATAEQVREIVNVIPPFARLGARGRMAAAASLAGSLVLGVAGWAATRAGPAPDMILVGIDGAPGDPLVLREVSLRLADWPAGSPIHLRPTRRFPRQPQPSASAGTVSPSPDGRRLVFEDVAPDSGVMDLFLADERGGVKRLTFAAGDDVMPRWAPDGRTIVFATGRWTPPDDRDYDLALLDVATGTVRQLTSGTDADRWPVWSPDGTRIAFLRGAPDGPGRVCWITPGGTTTECPFPPIDVGATVLGWRGPTELLYHEQPPGSEGAILLGHLMSGLVDTLARQAETSPVASPDGEWVVASRRTEAAVREYRVIPTREPTRWRPLEGASKEFRPSFLAVRPDSGQLARLDLRTEEIPPGAPILLEIGTADLAGRAVSLAPGVGSWESRDTTVAVIDPGSGVVRGIRPGQVWIRFSAGGWLEDSSLVAVMPPAGSTRRRHTWEDSAFTGWVRFGEPLPKLVPGEPGQRAFAGNGDGVFESGAVSPPLGDGGPGLGVELRLSTPIHRSKWQTQRIYLTRSPTLVRNGAIGHGGCTFSLPDGEGEARRSRVSMGAAAGIGSASFVRPDLTDGHWYTLTIQYFPDRTCGFAIDGTPLWRSSAGMIATGPFHLVLFGQSVGTRILVGAVESWEGVRTHIDWRKLDWKPR